jgi:hypothetical protein
MLKDNHNIDLGQLVDETLKTSPDFYLPEDFAQKMALRFEKMQAIRVYFREFLIYVAAGIGMLAITAAMFFFLMSETWDKLLKWAGSNIIEMVGFAVVLIFILFADRVLLRFFYLKTNRYLNYRS